MLSLASTLHACVYLGALFCFGVRDIKLHSLPYLVADFSLRSRDPVSLVGIHFFSCEKKRDQGSLICSHSVTLQLEASTSFFFLTIIKYPTHGQQIGDYHEVAPSLELFKYFKTQIKKKMKLKVIWLGCALLLLAKKHFKDSSLGVLLS